MNGGEDNECKVPPQKGIWTIHGIWPSRFSTRLNQQPACCDASLKFDVASLQSIRDQLKNNWPSVRKGTFNKPLLRRLCELTNIFNRQSR